MQIINKQGKDAVFTAQDEIVLTDFCSRIAVAAEKSAAGHNTKRYEAYFAPFA